MSLDPAIEKSMVQFIPDLRKFAFSLCRNRDRADDIVQETLMRAIAGIDTFQNGSNLEAWLFTILRNNFSSDYRRSRRSEPDIDGRHAASLTVLPEQEGWCIAEDLRAGLGSLPAPYREALFLVGVSGLGYDEAAAIAGCLTGTMKSRVNRARRMLAAAMSDDTLVHENSRSDPFFSRVRGVTENYRRVSASRRAATSESNRPEWHAKPSVRRKSTAGGRSRLGKRHEPAVASRAVSAGPPAPCLG